MTLGLICGCATKNRQSGREVAFDPPLTVVVAPVLNLSDSTDFDPLRVTDLLASELLSFRGISVVPVNLTLAALDAAGAQTVTSHDDAVALASALGADATIVAAVTEYNPSDPPVIGMVAEWHERAPKRGRMSHFDPTAASREASDMALVGATEADSAAPLLRVQRVFNASDNRLLEDVAEYGEERDGAQSPYGWRMHTKSQQAFMRYCCHATIRTMLTQKRNLLAPAEAEEDER
ncbi:MAG: hypothetical protein KDA32_08550 [Phycisphaerales bacterium]|nr:hypothetical protein [Phycisphaerales bacterium]